MHIGVVGHGLIGAAAAKHLAAAGHRVTLIGPPEPTSKTAHHGPFASHYDEGRIVRVLDHSPLWARIKAASIGRFHEIEAQSGIAFFHRSGGMMAGPAGGPLVVDASRVGDTLAVPPLRLDGEELRRRFPFFRFPTDWIGFFEPGAGWLNPRRLIDAQTACALAMGAEVIPETVIGINETGHGVELTTPHRRLACDRALIAAGAFARELTATPLPVEVYARTVLFAEIDPAAADGLAAMPTMVTETEGEREPYLLPPILYPDGRLWLKIGGDPRDLPLTPGEVGPWFRSSGNPNVAEHLREILFRLMPSLNPLSTRTEACVVTFASGDRPLIDRLSDRIAIATAGCARGAKASDELGRLGAAALLGELEDGPGRIKETA